MKRAPPSGRRVARHPAARRRVFLAITVARPGPPLRDLPAVEPDAARLARLFAGLGYRVAPSIRNPSAAVLRVELADRLAGACLGRDDDLVVYYSGHGCVADGTHHLCTAGFDRDQLATRAFRTEELVELVVRRRPRPGKLWLILDCCQAGAVMTEGLFRVLGMSQTAAFVMAATGSWGEATDGSFAAGLESTVAELWRRPGMAPSLDAITAALNARRTGHPAVQASLSSARFDFLDGSGARPRHRGASPRSRARRPPRSTPCRRGRARRW